MGLEFDRAAQAWEDEKFEEAYRWFLQGAEAGNRDCFLNLGYCFDVGRGTVADKKKAMLWYRRAYANGEGAAANSIAILYREHGFRKLEFHWFQLAARRGDGDAFVDLAKLYSTGTGARQSVSRAKRCLKLALRSQSICPSSLETAEDMLSELR